MEHFLRAESNGFDIKHIIFSYLKTVKLTKKKEVKCQADSGYQGIKKNYENSMIPKKKPKNDWLSKKEKSIGNYPQNLLFYTLERGSLKS